MTQNTVETNTTGADLPPALFIDQSEDLASIRQDASDKDNPNHSDSKEKLRVLIAEDDPVSLRILFNALEKWEYKVTVAKDGSEALSVLEGESPPRLAILDWMMPGMDGTQVCEHIRKTQNREPPYIILLTANTATADIVRGLMSGADDYLTKPFDREELRARILVGERVLRLQMSLNHRVRELEDALSHVKQLQRILPICSYCKSIRNDSNYWQQVDHYIAEHTETQFSHSICPQCFESEVLPAMAKRKAARLATSETFVEDYQV